jgi:D-inositol-3-phosphate glycosyltransferase
VKKTIAIYGDTPTVCTGFGNVIKSIFTNLIDDFDIKIFGINYNGYPHEFPHLKIYPACNPLLGAGPIDYYGREHLKRWVEFEQFDLFFILNDAWLVRDFMPDVVERVKKKGQIPVVCYFPIDCEELDGVWYDWLVCVDVPVTYTEFALDTVKRIHPTLGIRTKVIPHGADPETFRPIPPGSNPAVAYYKKLVGDFAFINVNKNQVRKNIPCSIAALREYQNLVDNDDTLVLHMNEEESIGCNIRLIANSLNFKKNNSIRVSPARLSEEQLNAMYNACRVTLTTSIGDGWGLSISESICAGIPVIAPRHTSFPEVVRDFGYLYDPGLRHSALPFGTDRSNWRYYADPRVVAKAMLEVRTNYTKYKEMALQGRKWYQENRTWKHHVVPQWRELFKQLLS